jgi:hypothetical protein
MLNHSMNNLVGSAFYKQASTAPATADEFDALISLSELFSSLLQLFLKHCADTNSLRAPCEFMTIFSLHLWIPLKQLQATRFALSHVASPA